MQLSQFQKVSILLLAIFVIAVIAKTFFENKKRHRIAQTKETIERIRAAIALQSGLISRSCPSSHRAAKEANYPKVLKEGSEKKVVFVVLETAERSDPRTQIPWPSLASLNANNVLVGGDCLSTEITAASLATIVRGSVHLPGNPSGNNHSSTVERCLSEGCDRSKLRNCDGGPFSQSNDGWCYNPENGEFWSNVESTAEL